MNTNIKNEIVTEIITLVKQLAASEQASDAASTPIQQEVELLTIKECTEVVRGLSEHTIRQLITQGKLPYVRSGQGLHGKILVNKAELLLYFKTQSNG